MINLVLIDDHAILREGLKQLISNNADMHMLWEGSSAKELLQVLSKQKRKIDILLCDINLENENGIELTYRVKQLYPMIKVIILTMHKEEFYVLKAIEASADGYLHKDILEKELIEGIKRVHAGEKYYSQSISQVVINKLMYRQTGKNGLPSLTSRESEILALIVKGNNNREISKALHISVRTVGNHRANILRKFGLKNTAELVRFAIEHQLL